MKNKLLRVTALLILTVFLFGCAGQNTKVTVNNQSKTEYDIIPPMVRAYFTAAESYDTEKYDTSISATYIGKDTKPQPIKLSWSYGEKDNVSSAKVYVSQNEDFSNAEIYETDGNEVELLNVFTGTKYYWYVEAFTDDGNVKSDTFTFDVAEGVRLISIDGVGNCRDLGGWKTLDGKTVKQGLAYRTARLSGVSDKSILITEKGIDTAVNKLKIKTELDLRAASEMRDEKVPEYGEMGEKVNYINIPSSAYASFLSSMSAKDELMLFADIENYPILFHCAGGADRTGTLAFMIKALLGVDEKNLIIDHELTYGRYINDEKYNYAQMTETFKKLKGDSFSEKARYCMTNNLKMSEMAVSNICNIFLNDGAIFAKESLEIPKNQEGKVAYKLIMRESQSIQSVEIDGGNAEFTLANDTITVTAPEGKHTGVITFDDGTTLNFNYK